MDSLAEESREMMFTHTFVGVCAFALGVLVYDHQLERTIEPTRHVRYCPPANAAGEALAASMVSSAAGTPTVHECLYR